jgi:hypothetical protein
MLSFIPLVPLIFFNERALNKKKGKYLPPLVHVEGGGIKRGLTAAEAAALLELPLNKVLTLILFGMLKKGILRQVQADPLQVEVTDPFKVEDSFASKKDEHRKRREAAQEMGVVLHKYEQDFLDVLEREEGERIEKTDFSGPMKGFLKHVAVRVKGFNLDETREYYRRIVTRAVTEAKSLGEIPELEQALDRNLEWILMSDDYPTVFAPRPTYTYFPHWVRTSGHPSAGGGPSLPGSGGSGGSTPRLGDVAGGFAGWTENTMGSLASTILPGKVAVEGTRGFINLGGLDKATSDVFDALSSGSGSGGGGGSSCACACAGCACACACAGGGR